MFARVDMYMDWVKRQFGFSGVACYVCAEPGTYGVYARVDLDLKWWLKREFYFMSCKFYKCNFISK